MKGIFKIDFRKMKEMRIECLVCKFVVCFWWIEDCGDDVVFWWWSGVMWILWVCGVLLCGLRWGGGGFLIEIGWVV